MVMEIVFLFVSREALFRQPLYSQNNITIFIFSTTPPIAISALDRMAAGYLL